MSACTSPTVVQNDPDKDEAASDNETEPEPSDDNTSDSTYRLGESSMESVQSKPVKRKSSAQNITPKKRRATSSSVNTKVKTSVIIKTRKALNLNPDIIRKVCAVTRAHSEMTVLEFSHILPAATPREMVIYPTVLHNHFL